VRTTSTEVNEATTPLVIWRKEYRVDSAGVGEFRGGLGQVIEVGHGDGEPFVVSKMFDRVQHPARGRRGGGDGVPGRVYLRDREGRETVLRGKGRDEVPSGSVLVMETPGGGGLGDVRRRDPERVREDVAAGRISELAARDAYCAKPP
jgi:N-methylhydantoinase B